jgi:hypothetical protein
MSMNPPLVGWRRRARHSTIETIGQPAQKKQGQPDCESAENDSDRGSETKAEASNGDLIGAQPHPCKPASCRIERRVYEGTKDGIKHEVCLKLTLAEDRRARRPRK